MANNPINMIKIRQILRLHCQGYSKLAIAAQSGVSRNTRDLRVMNIYIDQKSKLLYQIKVFNTFFYFIKRK